MPPKNIVATKATYRDLITISWDAVDSADGYSVYRREYGSDNEWSYRSTSATTSFDDIISANDDTKYEYTVLTQKNGLESAKQNYFENGNNVGYVLAIPNGLVGVDLGNGYFKLSWKKVDGATDYPITLNGTSLDSISNESIENASSSISEYSDKAITFNQNTGIIDLYLSKAIHAPVSNTVYIAFTVSARNIDAVISSKNTTSPVGTQFMYSSLNRSEVANIVSYNLNSVFSALNTAAGGDWWTGNWESIDGEFGKTKIVSESTISASRAYSSGWSTSIKNEGEVKLTNYSINSNYLTGTMSCRTEEGNYLKTNPLQKISSSSALVIQLPGKFSDIKVSFSDYYVDNGGSGKISITYDNDSWELTSLPVKLL